MKILCPSKTFLFGEYAVLAGGPAILISTPPCFSWDNEGFYDPYDGKGGFGASGAEFVIAAKRQGVVDPWKLWGNYKSQQLSGSGADIISQWMGGITYFFAREKIIEKLSWPFSNLYIGLIHTGYKTKTHEHLDTLSEKDFSHLEKIVQQGHDSLKNAQQDLFLKSISDYNRELLCLNLVAETTKILLHKLSQQEFVLSAKGCGALGADVILVVIDKASIDKLESWCEREKLNLVFCDNQFAEGAKQYD